MDLKARLRKSFAFFLVFRIFILAGVCILLFFFCSILLNFTFFVMPKNRYFFVEVFEKNEIIRNIARNCVVIIDWRLDLFVESNLKILLFLFSVVLLRVFIRLKNTLRIAAPFLIFLGAFFYCFWLMNFSHQVSGAIASAIFILYTVNFIVYEQKKIFNSAASMNALAC